MLKTKKAQVDIALTIGAIVIPAAALIGSLIFAFALLGPLTDAARLAAVIAHDTVTLADVAYSVPDNIKVYYQPPRMCQFVEPDDSNVGCNAAIVSCEFMETEEKCQKLVGCAWTGTECVDECRLLDEDRCENEGCIPYYDRTVDGESIFSYCSGDGVGVYEACETFNENDCNSNKDVGCFWEEPTKRQLSCLNGFMNISNFGIQKGGKETKTIYGKGDFVYYIKAIMPARFPRHVLEDPLLIEYPGFANLKDYGYGDVVEFKIVRERILISKIRDGIYDTLNWVYPKYDGDPIYEILQLAYDSCWSGTATDKEIVLLPMYYIKIYNIGDVCLKRVAQDPQNVVDETQQTDVDIYCFDISKLNSIERCEFTIDNPSFNNRDSYLEYRSIKVVTQVSCISSVGCTCDISIGKCYVDESIATKPYFGVTINLEENP